MIQKYSKVTKEDYRNWYLENGKVRECARSDKKSLKFHLMPASGWLNDPNGLHQKKILFTMKKKHLYYSLIMSLISMAFIQVLHLLKMIRFIISTQEM